MHSMQVLEELLLQRNYQHVIYLGDGKGDYCPCSRLGPNDHILARQNYPDGSDCSLLKLLEQQGALVKDSRQNVSQAATPPRDGRKVHDSEERSAQKLAPYKESSGAQHGSGGMSHVQGAQTQLSDVADADATKCQDASDPGSPQKTALPPPPVKIAPERRTSAIPCAESASQANQTHDMINIHSSIYSWNAAAAAAELLQQLIKQCT